MRILVLNSGSSSIKYKFYDFESMELITHGALEEVKENRHELIENILCELHNIDIVAHRVVHGGERFHEAVIIDEDVTKEIQKLCILAPLHNPSNLDGIKTAKIVLPQCIQIAVFDTAFHQTMPPSSYMYALSKELYEKYGIRRYGFHGTSHSYLLKECARVMHKEASQLNIITLHLGNGASATAIKNGKSYDTSMGFTPLEGLVMGTRSGDFDPEILIYLMRLGYSADQLENLINKKSGLLGICGSSDLREIVKKDDSDSHLALAIMSQRIKKYIGAYTALLGRVDAIIFSGGVGEHSYHVRQMSLDGLKSAFGIALDQEKNKQALNKTALISSKESKVPVFMIPTDEELEIAMQAHQLIKHSK